MAYLKYFILSLWLLALTGCKENLSYSYLMHHPQVLKREMESCHSDISSSLEREKYCRIVMYAAENLLSFLRQQQEDPEEFGHRLLILQTNVVKTKNELINAQKLLHTLQQKNASTEEINNAKENRDRLQAIYKEQYEEMKVKLAVIGVNTPD